MEYQRFESTALILEGGGMRNAYTAACITELINNNIEFGWVGGVSAGATHTANFLSHDAARARQSFVGLSKDPNIGGWGSLLRGEGYFRSEYIYNELPVTVDQYAFDYETFSSNPTQYRIGAIYADTGETVYFSREDNTGFEVLMNQVRASSTMPFFMPVTYIDGRPLVDGALGESGGIPLKVAEQDGFDKFLVILSRPRDYFKKPIRNPRALRRVFKKHPKVAEALISRPARYNATKNKLLALEAKGKAKIFFPTDLTIGSRETSAAKVEQAYNLGLKQTKAEWDSWMDFLVK